MDDCHLVQQSSTGRIKFITLQLIGDTLYREWGLLGGKTQETENTYGYKNEGRKNEKTPEDVAQEAFDRILKKKTKNGYRIVDDLDSVTDDDVAFDTMNFDDPPTSFAPSKPIKIIPDDELQFLLDRDLAEVQLKENGLCHYIFIGTNGTVRITGRKLHDYTRKYPAIVSTVGELIKKKTIPTSSVLGVELIVDGDGNDHRQAFRLMQQIARSDCAGDVLKENVDKSLALQEVNPVRCCVFYAYYWDGKDAWENPSQGVLQLVRNTFLTKEWGGTFFTPEVIPFKTVSEIDEYLEGKKTIEEGLVIWDLSESVEVRFTGTPNRRACYKRKLDLETDVVAYDWIEGSGDLQGKVGSLKIGKYDSEGNFVDMGAVAGLKDYMAEIDFWTFPEVIEIVFDEQFPTGKFQFPRYSKTHEDKKPEDCVLEEGEITE
jgi:predicted DNA-binding WGR domain protein